MPTDFEALFVHHRFLILSLILVALGVGSPTVFAQGTCPGGDPKNNTCTSGPDVTVVRLTDLANHGSSGSYRGFSVGTDSCNIGDTAVNWCDNPGGCAGLNSDQHPVIAGNLYRVMGDRFEQLGKSWLKHGFLSLNDPQVACGSDADPNNPPSCVNTSSGDLLHVGCTDVYNSSLNGSRPLGMRYEVNAAAGTYPFPETLVGSSGVVEQRIRVHEDDLEPALNSGARYFIEGHYVVDNDAAAGNGMNNASYREVSVAPVSLNLNFASETVRERSAIRAWQTVDPAVELVDADILGAAGVDERFVVGRKINFNAGVFKTVIAVHNVNSDLGARSLTVDFGAETVTISNPYFRGVDNHSGEFASGQPGTPQLDNTPWAVDTAGLNGIAWSTDDFATEPAANALRWSSTFTFEFESDLDPNEADYSIGFYKANAPSSLEIAFTGSSPLIFTDGFESGNTSSWSAASR